MKIAILDTRKAYLPEISAYISYLEKNGITAVRIYKDILDNINKYDIIWKFTGVDFIGNNNGSVVHEYNSLTVGKLKWIKDTIKKQTNIKPEGRVFLNNEVKAAMNFKDNVPSIIRDMGIAKEFFVQNPNKEYDFVYIGAMEKSRQLDQILHSFKQKDIQKNILMIGRPNDELYAQFKDNKNIIFTGIVNYKEVPKLASKGIYGLNYVPDVYPFNKQTSTKLLEYCALGLNIVTTDYYWVRNFEEKENSSFYKITNKTHLDFESIDKFNYRTADVMKYEWNTVLNQSRLIEFINQIR